MGYGIQRWYEDGKKDASVSTIIITLIIIITRRKRSITLNRYDSGVFFSHLVTFLVPGRRTQKSLWWFWCGFWVVFLCEGVWQRIDEDTPGERIRFHITKRLYNHEINFYAFPFFLLSLLFFFFGGIKLWIFSWVFRCNFIRHTCDSQLLICCTITSPIGGWDEAPWRKSTMKSIIITKKSNEIWQKRDEEQ